MARDCPPPWLVSLHLTWGVVVSVSVSVVYCSVLWRESLCLMVASSVRPWGRALWCTAWLVFFIAGLIALALCSPVAEDTSLEYLGEVEGGGVYMVWYGIVTKNGGLVAQALFVTDRCNRWPLTYGWSL